MTFMSESSLIVLLVASACAIPAEVPTSMMTQDGVHSTNDDSIEKDELWKEACSSPPIYKGDCPNYYGCVDKKDLNDDVTLETVQTLVSQSKDSPDEVVVRMSAGKYSSCAHIATASMCGHKMAKRGCPQACASEASVDEASVSETTEAPKHLMGKCYCEFYCSYDKRCCLDESAYHKVGKTYEPIYNCDNKPKYKGACPNYYGCADKKNKCNCLKYCASDKRCCRA